MIELTSWLEAYLYRLNDTFTNRVLFVGLQGSYSRGEATESSDIDMVVILDEVNSTDVIAYHAMLDTLPHRDLLCGFFAGKAEIDHWESSDLFQLYFDTVPIQGCMDDLLERLDADAVNRAIKLGACNIYHGCVHNMLYDKSEKILKNLFKCATFVIQAICYQQSGNFIRYQTDLLKEVSEEEQQIISIFLSLKTGEDVYFLEQSELIFNWAKKRIKAE